METIYTCPAGKTCIVKRITLFNLNTTTTNTVAVLSDLGAFDRTPIREQSLAPRVGLDVEVWWVLAPGNELALSQSETTGVNYLISGTELAGVSS